MPTSVRYVWSPRAGMQHSKNFMRNIVTEFVQGFTFTGRKWKRVYWGNGGRPHIALHAFGENRGPIRATILMFIRST